MNEYDLKLLLALFWLVYCGTAAISIAVVIIFAGRLDKIQKSLDAIEAQLLHVVESDEVKK